MFQWVRNSGGRLVKVSLLQDQEAVVILNVNQMARVQAALAIVEEARRKAEVARLEVEWTSLLLEIGATKDEVSSFQS